jgi:DNA-binding transcriptional ArsR family regulator
MALKPPPTLTEAQQRLVTLAKALGNPARVAILAELSQRRSCVCGELVDVLPHAQATVSQHLKVLKEAGLVQGKVDGPRSCYCLDADGLVQARAALNDLFDALAAPAGCCA